MRVQGIGRGKEGVDKLSDSSRGARNTSFDPPALFFYYSPGWLGENGGHYLDQRSAEMRQTLEIWEGFSDGDGDRHLFEEFMMIRSTEKARISVNKKDNKNKPINEEGKIITKFRIRIKQVLQSAEIREKTHEKKRERDITKTDEKYICRSSLSLFSVASQVFMSAIYVSKSPLFNIRASDKIRSHRYHSNTLSLTWIILIDTSNLGRN